MRDLPKIQELFTVTPLYESFRIGSWNYDRVFEIETYTGTFDIYCVECGKGSVYKAVLNTSRWFKDENEKQQYALSNRVFQKDGHCTRNGEHKFYCTIRVKENQLTKIGQYPSLADLAESEIKKYRKPLGEQFTELSRAVGLAAHGIGIGSFVYLRRIFETLIEEAHTKAIEGRDWDEEAYTRVRMDEKIVQLKGFLPEFLVENRNLYSILSKGIHELDEETCLGIFEPLKTGIELILDEKLAQAEKEKKEAEAKKKIADISDKLRKST